MTDAPLTPTELARAARLIVEVETHRHNHHVHPQAIYTGGYVVVSDASAYQQALNNHTQRQYEKAIRRVLDTPDNATDICTIPNRHGWLHRLLHRKRS